MKFVFMKHTITFIYLMVVIVTVCVKSTGDRKYMELNQINPLKEIKLGKTSLALLGIFFLVTLTMSSANVAAQEPPLDEVVIEYYDVTINAYCINEGINVTVDVTYNESSYATPYTFFNLTGENTFEVPPTDPNGHPFAYWQDDESLTNPERNITDGGEYIAVYFDPTIVAEVNIDPDTFNLKSKGKFITVYIELPEGYDVEDINISTVELEGVPAVNDTKYGFVTDPVPVDRDGDGIMELMVKFDRSAVKEIIEEMIGDENEQKFIELELKVTGELSDGTPFEDSDTIRVKNPAAMKTPKSK